MTARARRTNETFDSYRKNLKTETRIQKRQLGGKLIVSKPKDNSIRLKNIEEEGEKWESACPDSFITTAPKTHHLDRKYEKELSTTTGLNL